MSNGPTVGDVRILQGHAVSPIMLPLIPKFQRRMQAPMQGLFGQTPIVTRKYGGNSLWDGTPLAASSASVGAVYEIDEVFSGWDNVGFEWNFPKNRLEAYLTKSGQTYRILIPASKIREIFEGTSKALGLRKSCLCGMKKPHLKEILQTTANWLEATQSPSVGGMFGGNTYLESRMASHASKVRSELSQLTPEEKKKRLEKSRQESAWKRKCRGFNVECFIRDVGKEIDTAVSNVGEGVSSFFKDPGQWIQHAARDIGKFVDEVGMVALDVVSHPIFTGIAGALSFIPPLNAVGGAALAASAAANAVKPALSVVGAVADAVSGDIGALTSIPGVPKIVKSIIPDAVVSTAGQLEKVVGKAASTVQNFKDGTANLPPAAQGLMVAALQSQPAPKTPKIQIAAQQTPRGVQASVYVPSAQGSGLVVIDAIRKLPPAIIPLWNKATGSMKESDRKLFAAGLREPLAGRTAFEAIYKAGRGSNLGLGVAAIRSLGPVNARRVSAALMKIRG